MSYQPAISQLEKLIACPNCRNERRIMPNNDYWCPCDAQMVVPSAVLPRQTINKGGAL